MEKHSQDSASRVNPLLVTEIDGRIRMGWLYDDLVKSDLDVKALAEKFGVKLKGDVPDKVTLVQLYPSLKDYRNFNGDQTYGFCVGIKRSDGDPKSGRVTKFWGYADGPEKLEPYAMSDAIPGLDMTPAIVQTDDVTVYAKYHLMFPSNSKKPILCVSPIQFTQTGGIDAGEVVEELQQMQGNAGSSDERHRVTGQINTLKSGYGSPFRYNDRNLVLALLALEIADRLGIDTITLPFAEVEKNPSLKGTKVMERYRQVEEMMKSQTRIKGLVLADWSDYVEGKV
ncbi:MAG: hypothetical protein V1744_02220 [Candidatus Altiarchaeota archaeon]